MQVIRVGDSVKLIDPRPIVRIGYDKEVSHLVDEVGEDEEVKKFSNSQGLDYRSAQRLIRAVACGRLAKLKKSGATRKIFYGDTRPDLVNSTFTVLDKQVRRTGEYDQGYNYRGDYYNEPEYEPPGLIHMKTHVCLKLNDSIVRLIDACADTVSSDTGFWVTSEQVKHVDH